MASYHSNILDPIYRRNDRIYWRDRLEVMDEYSQYIKICYHGSLDEVQSVVHDIMTMKHMYHKNGLDLVATDTKHDRLQYAFINKCMVAACLNNSLEVVQVLFGLFVSDDMLPDYFMAACFGNGLDVIRYLMDEYGYGCDCVDSHGASGFLMACYGTHH